MIAHKYRKKFVVAPDGDFVLVDRQIDPRVYFAADDDAPVALPTMAPSVNIVALATAMLDVDPSAIVAVYSDSKGRVLGSTITRTTNGHTPAAFRASFRSLPREAKQVHFATVAPIRSEVQAAVTASADHFLCRVVNFLTITPA
jgi:hypothetical protein